MASASANVLRSSRRHLRRNEVFGRNEIRLQAGGPGPLDALAFPEILPEVAVIVQGNRLGEIEPKPFDRGGGVT
jgi:hypothetical protein